MSAEKRELQEGSEAAAKKKPKQENALPSLDDILDEIGVSRNSIEHDIERFKSQALGCNKTPVFLKLKEKLEWDSKWTWIEPRLVLCHGNITFRDYVDSLHLDMTALVGYGSLPTNGDLNRLENAVFCCFSPTHEKEDINCCNYFVTVRGKLLESHIKTESDVDGFVFP